MPCNLLAQTLPEAELGFQYRLATVMPCNLNGEIRKALGVLRFQYRLATVMPCNLAQQDAQQDAFQAGFNTVLRR